MNHNWNEVRLKEYAQILLSNIDKKTYEGEKPVLLCNYTDVYYNKTIHKDIKFMPATASEAQIKKLTLKYNDVIITKDSESADDIGIPAIVKYTEPNLVCGYHLAIIRSKKLNGDYVNYLFQSKIAKEYFLEVCLGFTRVSLNKGDILNLKFNMPSLLEQTKIANYLDTETSKIDRKISILEQKYKKLEEYKQSVIFETVTKGLNSNVAMKYSGIDWIGDIPAHWEIKRVKDTSKIKKGKAVETFFEKDSNMLPCIDTNFLRGRDNVVYCSNGVKILSDKVLILWDGANAGELFFNKDIGYLGSTFGLFNTTLNNQFWFYYLKGIEQYSRDNLTGMGIPHVDGNVLKQTIALVPSKQEQELIVNFLNIETSKIDKKKEIIKKQIELLKEYKQTIIYEAVTGKKEIL